MSERVRENTQVEKYTVDWVGTRRTTEAEEENPSCRNLSVRSCCTFRRELGQPVVCFQCSLGYLTLLEVSRERNQALEKALTCYMQQIPKL